MQTLLLLLLPLLAAPLQDGNDEADRLAARAASLVEAGQAADAVPLWREVVRLRDASPTEDGTARARARHNLAWALSLAERSDEAWAMADQALQMASADGPTPATVAIRRNRAEIAWRAGRVDQAWREVEAAVAEAESVYGKAPMTGELHDFAGQMALARGDWDAAREHLEWAAAIVEHVFGTAEPERLAGPLHGLAEALAAQGELDAALSLRDFCLDLLEGADRKGSLPWRVHREAQARLLRQLGEIEWAAESLAPVLGAEAAAASSAPEARLALALRWLEIGRPDAAAPLLEAAPASTTSPLEVAWLAARARAAAWTGQSRTARSLCLQALELLPPPAANGDAAREPLELLYAELLLGDGEAEAALVRLRPLLHARQADLEAGHPALLPLLVSLIRAQVAGGVAGPPLESDLQQAMLCWKSMSPGARWAMDETLRRETGSGLQPWLAEAWMVLATAQPESRDLAFQELDALRLLGVGHADAWWWESEAPREGAAVSHALAAARLEGRGAEREAARAALTGPDDRWLCLIEGADSMWAWLLAPDPELDGLLRLGAATDLRRQAEAWLSALADPARTAESTACPDSLLAPLWPRLQAARSVRAVAEGTLAWLPLEALRTPDGSYWVSTCHLRYAPAVGALLALEQGDPARGEGGAHLETGRPFPLDAACHRWKRLLSRFGWVPGSGPTIASAEIRPAGEATWSAESALAEASADGGLRSLGFLRVHAPAFLDTQVPSATGIALGPEDAAGRALWQVEDGFLELPEIAALDLAGTLVWLSAAGAMLDAGNLRAEGLFGLVDACWRAGSPSVLVSSWEAPRGAGAAFDADLQQRLRQSGAAEFLWRCQRAAAASDNAARRDPAVWARYRQFGR